MLIFPQSRSYSTWERFVIKLSVYALSLSLLLRKIQLPRQREPMSGEGEYLLHKGATGERGVGGGG